MANQVKYYLNGIDGETGHYLIAPLEVERAVALAKGLNPNSAAFARLRRQHQATSQRHLGVDFDLDETQVSQVGWGIVFHQQEAAAVREALAPLIAHRQQQVGDEAKVKVLNYGDGQSAAAWLAAHGIGAGTIEPTRIPFYLLFIGSPELIPYSFCQEIDVEYAVGRLHFDTAEEYARYVASVIGYETADAPPTAKEAVFFGARHEFDEATQLSADWLVKPLVEGVPANAPGVAQRWGFATRKLWGETATKQALYDVLRASQSPPPALLFTASHGMGFKPDNPRQRRTQGALLCQDWPGFGQVSPEHYFAAEDVPAEARLHGLMAFFFACFGGGTPVFDNFVHQAGQAPPRIAERPFLAALPQALLAHPRGGALACIGHVERAWSYSIATTDAGPQLKPFQNALGRLLAGHPVGLATRTFNERYASLSTRLSNLLEQAGFGAQLPDYELANVWVERNDAGGYVVIGDPAVRLRVSQMA